MKIKPAISKLALSKSNLMNKSLPTPINKKKKKHNNSTDNKITIIQEMLKTLEYYMQLCNNMRNQMKWKNSQENTNLPNYKQEKVKVIDKYL